MAKQSINKAIPFAEDVKSMMYDVKRYNAVIKVEIVSQTTVVADIVRAVN